MLAPDAALDEVAFVPRPLHARLFNDDDVIAPASSSANSRLRQGLGRSPMVTRTVAGVALAFVFIGAIAAYMSSQSLAERRVRIQTSSGAFVSVTPDGSLRLQANGSAPETFLLVPLAARLVELLLKRETEVTSHLDNKITRSTKSAGVTVSSQRWIKQGRGGQLLGEGIQLLSGEP
jgi:hypothetical protein